MLLFLRSARAYSSKRLLKRPKLLGVYSSLPCDLFRINSSKKVILRDHDTQVAKNRMSYDLFLDNDGIAARKSVFPSAGFEGNDVTIYKLPKGLELKSRQLTCFWEHSDHHSVQTTVPIKLAALNDKLTQMCLQEGEKMTKKQLIEKLVHYESPKYTVLGVKGRPVQVFEQVKDIYKSQAALE